jgi:hypothetical protein
MSELVAEHIQPMRCVEVMVKRVEKDPLTVGRGDTFRRRRMRVEQDINLRQRPFFIQPDRRADYCGFS